MQARPTRGKPDAHGIAMVFSGSHRAYVLEWNGRFRAAGVARGHHSHHQNQQRRAVEDTAAAEDEQSGQHEQMEFHQMGIFRNLP